MKSATFERGGREWSAQRPRGGSKQTGGRTKLRTFTCRLHRASDEPCETNHSEQLARGESDGGLLELKSGIGSERSVALGHAQYHGPAQGPGSHGGLIWSPLGLFRWESNVRSLSYSSVQIASPRSSCIQGHRTCSSFRVCHPFLGDARPQPGDCPLLCPITCDSMLYSRAAKKWRLPAQVSLSSSARIPNVQCESSLPILYCLTRVACVPASSPIPHLRWNGKYTM